MINGWCFVFANSHVEKDFINLQKIKYKYNKI